jgi:predicted O-methyltransferase YrrM
MNRCLVPLNLRIETLMAERAEVARLQNLDRSGHFGRPVFPLLPQFSSCDPTPLLDAVDRLREQTDRFSAAEHEKDYSYFNDYFTSPDAEVAYALVRQLKPKRIVEVGSGNSTKLFRHAIDDGGLDTTLVSIDPWPRLAIKDIADQIIAESVEHLPPSAIADPLGRDDILFIDSSHEIKTGNDVLVLFFQIVPSLRRGVIIHVHDIFLPYDYPREWIIDNLWDRFREQYIVQAILQSSKEYEVLWPGHYLQRSLPGFSGHFNESLPRGNATSLWLRKLS